MFGIDVAIPCFEYGEFLRDGVASVLSQPVENLRVLIIDNGSQDNSIEVATQLSREDSRVSVVAHKTNLGQHASYNEAVDWAQAKYFMISDADDILVPGSLARSISVLERDEEIAFAHGVEVDAYFPAGSTPPEASVTAVDSWSISSGADFIDRICESGRNLVGAATVVRRTSVQKQAGHYHRELDRAMDLNMWLRLALYGKVAETTTVQAVRRLHGRQLSSVYRDHKAWDLAERHDSLRHFFLHEGRSLSNGQIALDRAARSIASQAAHFGAKSFLKGRMAASSELLQLALRMWRQAR